MTMAIAERLKTKEPNNKLENAIPHHRMAKTIDEDKGQAMRLSILTCKTLNTATAATTPIRKCQYRIDNTKKKMVFRFNVQRQTRRLTMISSIDADGRRTTDTEITDRRPTTEDRQRKADNGRPTTEGRQRKADNGRLTMKL